MSYPLTIRFKVLAIARQLSVTDNTGRLLMYVKQKAFKLKEAITVFADEAQTMPLYRINADRVIDFSANYTITDAGGQVLGRVKQQGMRSIWRARFDMVQDDNVVFEVREENPWAKVGDAFMGDVPILGFFAGYLFHPKYLVSRADGTPVLRATKRPALFEGLFSVERLPAELTPEAERLLLIGTVTVLMLERTRG
jgi:uncharacterized protein YxjI